MQQVPCPGCGAPVSFRSAASVLAVCEYCRSTLLKDADAVRDLGKMGEVLEDYSPLRLGVSGSYANQGFSVVGRIQLRYAAGFWNEWYLLRDDGSAAWLSDASGQYAITREAAPAPEPPSFESLRAGQRVALGDGVGIVSDVRSARCVAGQGELPFAVGAGWEARVADLRQGNRFCSLDYSEGDAPKLYRGHAVTLDALRCQLLRAPEEIRDAAGRYKGKVGVLACPSCGASASYSPGATTHLICPACRAQIDTSGEAAQVLAAGERVAAEKTTLQLGARAVIDRERWTLIGLMRRAEGGDAGSTWVEYLLYSERRGFLWLIETDEGWERCKLLDEWPQWDGGGQIRFDGQAYTKLWDYEARVSFAAGAFNWRVAVGDKARVTEYRSGDRKLALEATAEELTWSHSTQVTAQQVAAWFGNPAEMKAASPIVGAPAQVEWSYKTMSKWLIVFLLVVNAVPFLVGPAGEVLMILLFAAIGIYVPAAVLDLMGYDA